MNDLSLWLRLNFEILFNFTDLLSSNIPIIQYFVGAASAFFLISILITFMFFVVSEFSPTSRKHYNAALQSVALLFHRDEAFFWVAYGMLLFIVNFVPAVLQAFGIYDFSIAIAPQLIFHGTLLYFFWVGYKNRLVPAKDLAFAALLGLFFFSFSSGSIWLKSEIRTQGGEQALIFNDGLCLERKIIRSSSNGFLLYSFSLRQFEFRNKDSVKTIFQNRGC